jgi:tetratricopeptide (TPR) repeat protein
MKKPLLLILFVLYAAKLFAAGNDADSLKQKVLIYSDHLDSLKQELELTTYDSLKAPIYTQIALEYIKYDTIGNKKARLAYQNLALTNTYSALHLYSRYNDTIGLRISFDNLASVYHAQHKYSQAKWFILQSNTLSRYKNDNPNIITSLLKLASIKADIKDYSLAMRDLNEALTISSKNHYPERESEVQLNYALLYSKMKNYDKSAIALKRHKAIDDSIRKAEESKLMAKLAARDSSLQAKKKFYTLSSKKSSKNNSSKRIALL